MTRSLWRRSDGDERSIYLALAIDKLLKSSKKIAISLHMVRTSQTQSLWSSQVPDFVRFCWIIFVDGTYVSLAILCTASEIGFYWNTDRVRGFCASTLVLQQNLALQSRKRWAFRTRVFYMAGILCLSIIVGRVWISTTLVFSSHFLGNDQIVGTSCASRTMPTRWHML